ncbi:type II toxin-antitoxin system death-on-curing family toxin [Streptomyces sp. NPDC054871]
MNCVHLVAEDVLLIAERVAGGPPPRVRDVGLVAFAVHRHGAVVSGRDAYAGVFEKAAALLQSLAANGPFVDGNRRTAWVSCVVLLAMNDVQLRPDIDAAERLVVAVAAGEVDDVKVISEALRELAEPPV